MKINARAKINLYLFARKGVSTEEIHSLPNEGALVACLEK
jgi:hypothetical protein